MTFANVNDLLKKIDHNGMAVIVSRGIAIVLTGVFLMATAVTLDHSLLHLSVISLLVCWMMETYFRVKEITLQQLYDEQIQFLSNDSSLRNTKSQFGKWFEELFISINGLFYLLAIFVHLFLLIIL
ncbi:hypothetical protein GCM10007049_26990 [Echinicola pacifica]|uniref:Uncharacterized protein n=1 Tax=Echinicola pacifica TaxID=346377 RepID=A0A918Q576_9BACT|nr:hypothetical protein [Echinicola pacifica]GGZ32181.1 hypothetical protein GCM10007049_26990 [Echinicola pacifica]